MTTARNHDPEHDPYGICFSFTAQMSATEQPSPLVQDEPQADPESGNVGIAEVQSNPNLDALIAEWDKCPGPAGTAPGLAMRDNEMPKDVAERQQEGTPVAATEQSEDMTQSEEDEQSEDSLQ